MACMDGFITSHAVENIELLETETVRKFIGEYNPEHYLLKKRKSAGGRTLRFESLLHGTQGPAG